jgi:hypothetical protein
MLRPREYEPERFTICCRLRQLSLASVCMVRAFPLAPLQGLSALESLDMSHCVAVTDVGPLKHIVNIKVRIK